MNGTGKLQSRWGRISRRTRWVVAIIVLVLVVGRLCLPFIVKSYVNRQLNRAKDYGGRIGDVEINLIRGEYSIHQLEILKKAGGVQSPFFSSPRLDLAIEWKELFHGAVVGQIIVHQPRVNFVAGPTAEQTQTGKDEPWNRIIESLFPFKINRFEIIDGEVHFQNAHSKPPVDIYFSKVSAVATNLSNSRDLKAELPAGVTAHASTVGGGGLDFQLQLNPLAPAPTFQLNTQLTNVDLVALNDFLKAYGKFDVERGVFAIYTSFAAKDGTYEGYFKVFFQNLDVFAWEKERQKNVLEVFWQAIVGTLATVLKNQPRDTLAARVPVSGTFESNSHVGIWSAITTLLRNAFIQALTPKVDEKVTVKKVEKKIEDTGKKKAESGNLLPSGKGADKLSKP